MEKKYSNSRVTYKVISENIVEHIYSENVEINSIQTEEDFHLFWKFVKDFFPENTKIRTLINIPLGLKVDPDATKKSAALYSSSPKIIEKQAYLCNSYFSKILIYIFNKIRSPYYEYAVFTNRKKAILWLKS